ncbi:hypothetical protein [Geomonas ferrireducens]|uniref:hypothetical protein n=1 Tax=Geomonas ferrireducens TaxID=2570227 RepID=UPI0010A90083|nr:hypothetical protein [Geomonas ferrireducens]
MKKTAWLLVQLTVLLLASVAWAVSYPPTAVEPNYLKDEDVMRSGVKLYLFHSGTQDVLGAIKPGQVLTGYREYPPDLSDTTKETGKVRVITTLGPYYFEAEVIEGFVRPGSIALKGAIGCLVTTRVKTK